MEGISHENHRPVRYIRNLDEIPEISPGDRQALSPVVERFPLFTNDYYLSLIDWRDPDDPIRRIIIPCPDELEEWGRLDACKENTITVARGVQHKYPYTVLFLCSEACGGYCRYCFRKRLFMERTREVNPNVQEGLDYISGHPEVTNVLLTGGDPLLLDTPRLLAILRALRSMEHIKIVRIGSKTPAFNPWRILNDTELLEGLSRYSTPEKRLYMIAHFDHPREITAHAMAAIDRLIRAGVICCNQCPLSYGVNDDPEVLAELFRRLSFMGCPPYYVFQGRPTTGNAPFRVPIVRSWHIFQEALRRVSGLARRARLVMSHASGKVEILAIDQQRIYMRYHRAKDPSRRGRFMICERNDEAFWFDDLRIIQGPEALSFPGEVALDPYLGDQRTPW